MSKTVIDLNSVLKIAATSRQTLVVAKEHTADIVGSGVAPVLATPVLVNLFEAAALTIIEKKIPQGFQSLGTHLDIHHTAATPIGMRVEAVCSLVKIEGRRLEFELQARDEIELIGKGRHTRVVVDQQKFDKNVYAKFQQEERI